MQPILSWPNIAWKLAKKIALIVLVLGFVLPEHATAQTTEVNLNRTAIVECIHGESNAVSIRDLCFGIIAEMCDERPLNATVGTVACWVEEYFAWHELMRSRYLRLVGEVDAEVLGTIQRSQQNWETQAELDCYLVASSNPQTHETLLPACRAEAALRRYEFLGELLGAEWVPLP